MTLPIPSLEIRQYQPGDASSFRELNLAWIEEHFRVEPIDREQLWQPERAILDRGGTILVAVAEGAVVGVCALLYEAPGKYEVTKMAVLKEVRGQGVGRQLLLAVVSHARSIGARELTMVSNTLLEPAMHLYRSIGFVEAPLPAGLEYSRANIAFRMGLDVFAA